MLAVDNLLQHSRIVLAGCNFHSSNNPCLDERSFDDREEKLDVVLELLHVLLDCGLLIELLPVSPCRLKNVDTLQAPERWGLSELRVFDCQRILILVARHGHEIGVTLR